MMNKHILLAALGIAVSACSASATSVVGPIPVVTPNADGSLTVVFDNLVFPPISPLQKEILYLDSIYYNASLYNRATVTVGLDSSYLPQPGDSVNVTLDNTDPSGDSALVGSADVPVSSDSFSFSFDPPFNYSGFDLTLVNNTGSPFTVDKVTLVLSTPDAGSTAALFGMGLVCLAGFKRSRL
jgi:hypothetical protein